MGTHLNDLPSLKWRPVIYMLAVLGAYLGGIDGSALYAWASILPDIASRPSGILAMFGAALVVYSVKAGALSFLLTSRPVQFLGRISYSLYLVHLPIILSVGCGAYLWCVAGQGLNRIAGAGIAFAVSFGVTVVVATVFTKLVDEPCIKLAKWFFPFQSRAADVLHRRSGLTAQPPPSPHSTPP